MNIDNFEIILLAGFFSKLLWNVIFPSMTQWMHRLWILGRINEKPQEFQMFTGLEVLFLLIFSALKGYEEASLFYGLMVVLFGVLLVGLSYLLCSAITKLIRGK
ncbi:hypothetical protein AVME950_21450 [Acidovorax sp. SUPP950]|uniref:hypothetical protein n=1 Tax=Acidovorax sp. SUPP950 TaxID=511901 RepID=UPI0023BFA093|nr:hypothetical protein [Acidovorax sp. SUPP950]GKS77508.1 hypothetical protein AVME950_21450 [Acidovorax sp. SUPP950]